jgi:hypothetical protein
VRLGDLLAERLVSASCRPPFKHPDEHTEHRSSQYEVACAHLRIAMCCNDFGQCISLRHQTVLEGNRQVGVAEHEGELREQVLLLSPVDDDRGLRKSLDDTGDEFACVVSPRNKGFLGPAAAQPSSTTGMFRGPRIWPFVHVVSSDVSSQKFGNARTHSWNAMCISNRARFDPRQR